MDRLVAKCKHCGTVEPDAFPCDDNGIIVNTDACIDCLVDIYEAGQADREQARREQLDAEGYYDDPVGWRNRNSRK